MRPDGYAAFAAGLRSGTLPPGLAAADAALARRFAVHRNNVAASLSRALAQRFPVVERLLGPDTFAVLARIFAERHRPQTPVLHEWGEALPEVLATHPDLAAWPYLADVARLELARGRAFHAADRPLLDGAALAAADPAALRLNLHPSVWMLRSRWPVVAIWRANRPGGTPAGVAFVPETALVLRDRALAVRVLRLDTGDAALAGALAQGETLLDAAAAAQRAAPGHDPTALLVRLAEAGAFTTPQE